MRNKCSRSHRAGDGALGEGGRSPLLPRAGLKHTFKCPSLILSVTSLDTPHPTLGSQDPIIPVSFLAMDRVGVRVADSEEERLDQKQGQGQGANPCCLSPSMFAFNAGTLGPVQ